MSSLYDSFVKIFLVTFCLNILSGIYSPGKKKSQEILNYHWSSVTVCVCAHAHTHSLETSSFPQTWLS